MQLLYYYRRRLWTPLECVEQDKYGVTETRKTFYDAVNIAICDQEKTGVDIISDGEMRRWFLSEVFINEWLDLKTKNRFEK